MNIHDILNALNLGEAKDWEFKSAKGGIPGSLWETYSAMTNTDGGVIVLGISEKDGAFIVQGLDDPKKSMQDFWNLANNKGKISINLLSNQDVSIEQIDGKSVLVVRVPWATRTQRPVFVGQNPLEGTFRRYNEGDYRCSQDEVGRMLADQSEQPADSLILPHFGLDDLDKRVWSSTGTDSPLALPPIRGSIKMIEDFWKCSAVGDEIVATARKE